MTKKEFTELVKNISGKKSDNITNNLLQLADFCSVVRTRSKSCFDKIYQADSMHYKIQSQYHKDWSNMFDWDTVIIDDDFTHFYLGDLIIVVENYI